QQAAHSQLRGETRAIEERRAALAESQPVSRIGDRKNRRVAPEPRAREDLGAERPQSPDVVAELEEPVAARTLQAIGERIVRPALDAGEALGQRLGRHSWGCGASGPDGRPTLPQAVARGGGP